MPNHRPARPLAPPHPLTARIAKRGEVATAIASDARPAWARGSGRRIASIETARVACRRSACPAGRAAVAYWRGAAERVHAACDVRAARGEQQVIGDADARERW